MYVNVCVCVSEQQELVRQAEACVCEQERRGVEREQKALLRRMERKGEQISKLRRHQAQVHTQFDD